MADYLDFKNARCKNCYKCLRECPVKAIAVNNHQAKVIDNRCILCGTCIHVCPQNAKQVHSDIDVVEALLKSDKKVFASVAPSVISSFNLEDFNGMKQALKKLGFYDAEETAIGAREVAKAYKKLLKSGKYKNFITSSCPSINRLIRIYYPDALPYLARVDSPMLAHAKILRKKYKDIKIVFIGPCIAKKLEADTSGIVDVTLTFEDLAELLTKNNIKLENSTTHSDIQNTARFFPINGGIIEAMGDLPKGYDYVAVDGIKRCMNVLKNINEYENVYLELNACEGACINGPCSLQPKSIINSTQKIKKFANTGNSTENINENLKLNLDKFHPQKKPTELPVSEREIKEILTKTGKFKPEDELNCGACGYSTCREKAWAVANGYADIEMCLPYMRERAESMSFEIIQNSPYGIIVVDYVLKIIAFSNEARKMLGVSDTDVKGRYLVDYFNPTDFLLAQSEEKKSYHKRIRIDKTGLYADCTITNLKEHKIMFGILIDITDKVNYDEKLSKVRMDTIATTDKVIKKQMRIAQEIASLLGETTAETKVALSKLKKMLTDEENKDE